MIKTNSTMEGAVAPTLIRWNLFCPIVIGQLRNRVPVVELQPGPRTSDGFRGLGIAVSEQCEIAKHFGVWKKMSLVLLIS